MPKTHTFDDGVTVELDDDVDPEHFLNASDATPGEDYAALVAKCEAEETTQPCDAEDEPDGGGLG